MSVITLTTDYGTKDWFWGAMKGVILCLAPRSRIVDISHEIPPGDIRAGAFALAASYHFFPTGTVHVAVVDPGVGSERQAIAVRTRDYFFVGPDNGVLSWALAREKTRSIRALENESYFHKPLSATFHGRDIFAPVAARLSQGLAIAKLGRPVKHIVRLDWPAIRRREGELRGEIVYIDAFGNCITNFDTATFRSLGERRVRIFAGGRRLELVDFYQAVPCGQPLALFGSSGWLEVCLNGRSAAQALGLRIGDPVTLSK